MGDGTINGVQFRDEEYNQLMREEDVSREQIRRQGSALVKRLAETYTQLTSLMEQNPELMETMEAEDRARKRAVEDKLMQGLRRANDAPRCRWVKQDGTSCKSPQMRNHIYCYAHRQMMEARALALRIPALEDANAIQIALMRVQKSLIDDTISMKKAGLLLYSLQLAMTNVGQTTFGKAGDDELVTNTVDEEEAISNQRSAESQDVDPFTTGRQSRNQKETSTTEARRHGENSKDSQNQNLRTEDTAELRGRGRNPSQDGANLIVSNADDRGFEDGIAPVVIRPILTRDLGLPTMGQTHAEMG